MVDHHSVPAAALWLVILKTQVLALVNEREKYLTLEWARLDTTNNTSVQPAKKITQNYIETAPKK